LDDLVPIEPASMVDRQIVEWDKDDLDALGCMKVDVLGLGMLGALSRGFDLLGEHKGVELDLASIPQDDPAVYDMICRADTIGVFQIESRAQMSMLPRLKPRTLDDLTVEVAVVRPGPIQGEMVHPYLRRREGTEPVVYPTPEFERVLGRRSGCRYSRNRRWASRSTAPASPRARPISFGARWRPSNIPAASPTSATSSSPAWSPTATTPSSPSEPSSNWRASAPTAFQ
jgi:hypothetical protein